MGCARLLLLAAAAAVAASSAAAQSRPTTGDILGVVTDVSAGIVAGATVEAVRPETGFSRSTVTDDVGRYVLPALPVGTYVVTFRRPGFAPLAAPDVEVTLGAAVRLDVTLAVAGVEVSVTVRPGGVETQQTAVASIVSRPQIDQLPANGRNFIAFALLTPAVALDRTPQQGASRTSGLSFAGQRGRSNSITVDGLDNTDETVGSVRALFSQEAIEAFHVLTSAYPAEFGKASGGVINIITRSGTNTLRGNGFAFFRDDALNAKEHFERFDPAGRPIDRPKVPFGQWQVGGTLGGPIRRDRAFFFASFEAMRARPSNLVTIDDTTVVMHPVVPSVVLGTPAQILRGAGFPVETGGVRYDVRANQFLGKIDVQRTPHTFSVRINAATELNENIEPFGGQVARSRAGSLQATDVTGAGAHTLIISDRALNETRAQVSLRNQVVRSLDPTCGGPCVGEDQGGPTLEVLGVASVGRHRFAPTRRDNMRYQVTDTLSLFRAGHEIKIGADVSYIHGLDQTLPLHFGGRYIFRDAALPLVPGMPPVPVSAIQQVALGLPLAYVQGYGNSGAPYDTADVSAFVQDTWRLRGGVTAAVGLRYQRQFWPNYRYAPAGYPAAYDFPGDPGHLAPRAGIAWDVDGNGRTVIRAAYGRFFDQTITAVSGISRYINGTDGVRTLVLTAPASFAAWAAPGRRFPEPTAVALAGGSYPSVAITIDPALQTPSAHHATVGAERALGWGLTVGASALVARGKHQLGTIDYNPLVPDLGPRRRPADVNGVPGTSASVLQYTSFGRTWYRGLSLSLERRFDGRSQLSVNYTLSESEDTSTDFQSAFLPQDNGRGRDPANPDGLPLGFDPESERGPSLQDQRHRLVASGRTLVWGGVQVSAIATVGSGRPFNILAGADLNGDGDGGSVSPDRARRVLSDPSTSVMRNAGRLPWQASVDVRIGRPVRANGVTIEPIVEIFNLLNRTNFTDVQNVFGTGSHPSQPSATFGQYTQAGPPRQMQLAVKVGF